MSISELGVVTPDVLCGLADELDIADYRVLFLLARKKIRAIQTVT